jgi:hypothetical protein
MRVRTIWAWAALAAATAGCASLLGDFETSSQDASVGEGGGESADSSAGDETPSGDAHPGAGDGALDGTVADSGTDGNGPPRDGQTDAPCGAGLTRCATGCVALDAATSCGSCTNDCTALVGAGHVVGSSIACTGGRCRYSCASGFADCLDSGMGCATNVQDASASCGACGHACNGGSCAAATCGAYIVAKQPTTGTVAKLATDGTRVIWSDTGIVAIRQIAATGGSAISLAATSSTNGAVSSELALAGSTVAFSYLGGSAPSVGLATVDVANSGVSAIPGAVAVNAISLTPAATHLFYVDITGTQGSVNDCMINGRDAGTCLGVAGGGRFLAQTAADSTSMFFYVVGANTLQAGLYLDTISTNTVGIFGVDVPQTLAVDGTWAYWTTTNDGGATYTIHRTIESAPTTLAQTVAVDLRASAFATDGANVYYWTGSAIISKPVAGGPETTLAPSTAFTQIAVGGGLLVWTDGATIWALVLPGA